MNDNCNCIVCTKRALADLEERRIPKPIIDIDTGLEVMDIEAYENRLLNRLNRWAKEGVMDID